MAYFPTFVVKERRAINARLDERTLTWITYSQKIQQIYYEKTTSDSRKNRPVIVAHSNTKQQTGQTIRVGSHFYPPSQDRV